MKLRYDSHALENRCPDVEFGRIGCRVLRGEGGSHTAAGDAEQRDGRRSRQSGVAMGKRSPKSVEKCVTAELPGEHAVRMRVAVVADVADHHRVALAEHERERTQRRPRRTVHRVLAGPHRGGMTPRSDAVVGELIADDAACRIRAAVHRDHQDSGTDLRFTVQPAGDVHELVGVEIARPESGELDGDLARLHDRAGLLGTAQTRFHEPRIRRHERCEDLLRTGHPAVGEGAEDVSVEDLVRIRSPVGWRGGGRRPGRHDDRDKRGNGHRQADHGSPQHIRRPSTIFSGTGTDHDCTPLLAGCAHPADPRESGDHDIIH